MKIPSMLKLSRGKAWLVGSAVVALSVTGLAVADSSVQGPTKVIAATTFAATTVSNRTVTTCTATDGTYEFTRATYSGTSTSADPNLNGAISVNVDAVYNTTTNLGWLKADLKVTGTTTGARAHARFTGVNVNGTVQGFLTGDESGTSNSLLSNATAAFTSAGGFTSASIGTGSATNTGISAGACNPQSSSSGHHGESGHHSSGSEHSKNHK